LLKHSFLHIPGIGPKYEQQLWAAGIESWKNFLNDPLPAMIKPAKEKLLTEYLEKSLKALETRDPEFFLQTLPSGQHWRVFGEFQEEAAYLDIETTGLEWDCHITTIALFDGRKISTYVYDENLDDFEQDIAEYKLIVTYNGKVFDIPFIEKHLGIKINQAHLDLRFILASLGYKGGLKGCEKQLGLDRGGLAGVDGFFAVLLWNEYIQTGNSRALETLLAYNVEDVLNLELLMIEACRQNMLKTPFKIELNPLSPSLKCQFSPDPKLIEKIKSRMYGFH
jgi:uncharacterized protein